MDGELAPWLWLVIGIAIWSVGVIGYTLWQRRRERKLWQLGSELDLEDPSPESLAPPPLPTPCTEEPPRRTFGARAPAGLLGRRPGYAPVVPSYRSEEDASFGLLDPRHPLHLVHGDSLGGLVPEPCPTAHETPDGRSTDAHSPTPSPDYGSGSCSDTSSVDTSSCHTASVDTASCDPGPTSSD